MTLKSLQDRIEGVRQKRERIEALKMQVTALSNELGDEVSALASINTRARSGYRAVYGPNSTQYEQSGGTRTDERKRAARKNGGAKSS